MYSAVLLTALTAGSATPNWLFHSGCYYAPSCYGCCGGCYGSCYGCCGGYGCAGPGYGYHGGCYGGYGNWYNDPSQYVYHGSCYGCYGGYSCFGGPLPGIEGQVAPVPAKETYAPINPQPRKQPMEDKGREETGLPKEKKIDEPKIDKGAPKKDTKLDGKQSRAKITIEVPVGGMLFVDGQRINAEAGRRDFQTPMIAAGQAFFYDIRIDVMRNGQPLSEQRRVIIEAGRHFSVAFPNLSANGTATARASR